MTKRWSLVCGCGAAAFLAGCGGGGGGSAPAAQDAGRATVGARGGTLASGDGSARVDFPADALLADTSFTAAQTSSVPATSRLVVGTAHEFVPSMTFSRAAQLTLQYDPSRLPAGAQESKLVLYKVVGADWVPVPGSVVDTIRHTVTAPVGSFSKYGILADNQFAGRYTGTFGGDASGTWSATVGVDGALTATASGGFTGRGSVSFTGASTIPLSGSGTTDGYRITFGGNFVAHSDHSITGSGAWNSSSGYHGTWTGGKTEDP